MVYDFPVSRQEFSGPDLGTAPNLPISGPLAIHPVAG
ncbi:hypothetical protein WG66_014270 [Moniliophthora roreri]|nr:hypothetical protein WG66_014270 [Moniliophthora roreri]